LTVGIGPCWGVDGRDRPLLGRRTGAVPDPRPRERAGAVPGPGWRCGPARRCAAVDGRDRPLLGRSTGAVPDPRPREQAVRATVGVRRSIRHAAHSAAQKGVTGLDSGCRGRGSGPRKPTMISLTTKCRKKIKRRQQSARVRLCCLGSRGRRCQPWSASGRVLASQGGSPSAPVAGTNGTPNSDWARHRLACVIGGAKKSTASCARRSLALVPEDAGSIPATSTEGCSRF